MDMKKNLVQTFTNLALLGGGTFNLSDYKGKMILLVFWRLGCPPCRKEMPWLQQIFEKYKEMGFSVVGFNHVDNETLVKQFFDKSGISYPNILDTSSLARKIYDDFNTNTVPLNFLIDRKGNLVGQWYGFNTNENEVVRLLEAHL
jgi:peroxiredoxin